MAKGEEIPVDEAWTVADWCCREVSGSVKEAVVCGSLRRGCPVVRDVDIVLMEPDVDALRELPWLHVKNVTADALVADVKVEFIFVPARAKGAAMLHATGSGDFNRRLRSRARSYGYRLNQYGLWCRVTGAFIAGETEEEIFALLAKRWIPPAKRGPCP